MAKKYTQSLAVLLNNGDKQILPVSKANLIELVGNTYTNHFSNIANPDVDTALAYLAGTYIPNATQEAKDYALGLVQALDGGTISLTSKQAITTISQADGQVSASAGNIDAQYVDVTSNYGEGNTTVETVLSYLKGQIDDARGDGEITVTRSTEDTSYAAVYTITQNSETKGTINIPKDMVATNGTLVHGTLDGTTFTPSEDGDAYIKMTIANGDAFYIDVKDLVEDHEFDNTSEITFTTDSTTGHISANVATVAASKISYNNSTVEDELGTINSEIDTLIGDVNTTNSVRNLINTAVTGLDSTAATAKVENGFTYVMTGVQEVDGLLTSTTYEALSDEKIKTTMTSGDALYTLANKTGQGYPKDISDVKAALNTLASEISAAQGDAVTAVTYTQTNTYVNVADGTAISNNTLTIAIDDTNLGNVSKLQYDELTDANLETVSLYGANPES